MMTSPSAGNCCAPSATSSESRGREHVRRHVVYAEGVAHRQHAHQPAFVAHVCVARVVLHHLLGGRADEVIGIDPDELGAPDVDHRNAVEIESLGHGAYDVTFGHDRFDIVDGADHEHADARVGDRDGGVAQRGGGRDRDDLGADEDAYRRIGSLERCEPPRV